LGSHACDRPKAALARTHSKTLRAQGGQPHDRQVLECVRVGLLLTRISFVSERATGEWNKLKDAADPSQLCSAGFQTCRVAGFQTCWLKADLEVCGTAGLETCATQKKRVRSSAPAPLSRSRQPLFICCA
jgi:hypothetical protein